MTGFKLPLILMNLLKIFVATRHADANISWPVKPMRSRSVSSWFYLTARTGRTYLSTNLIMLNRISTLHLCVDCSLFLALPGRYRHKVRLLMYLLRLMPFPSEITFARSFYSKSFATSVVSCLAV